MKDALILLLAGFIVVFSVLIILIVIVTLYSKIVRTAQDSAKKKAEEKRLAVKVVTEEKPVPMTEPAVSKEISEDGEIPGEIIAVIAAAVDSLYGSKLHKIKSVRKTRISRSAWSRAGISENTRPF